MIGKRSINYGATISAPHMVRWFDPRQPMFENLPLSFKACSCRRKPSSVPPARDEGAGCEYSGNVPPSRPRPRKNLISPCDQVGSGSGYTCAVFHHLVSPGTGHRGKVVGIDHLQQLVSFSIQNLRQDGLTVNTPDAEVEMVCGDGRQGARCLTVQVLWELKTVFAPLGYAPGAPYNAIHVGAAAPTMPQELIDQLASPGRLFIPVEDEDVGSFYGGQSIWQVDKDEQGVVTRKQLFGVRVSNPLLPTVRGPCMDR